LRPSVRFATVLCPLRRDPGTRERLGEPVLASKPLKPNDTAEGRAENRRVEFVKTSK
jgi:hypothetical protein